jgi:hypothetical protein
LENDTPEEATVSLFYRHTHVVEWPELL